MWQDMEFSDFAIVARGGKEIRCHKSVLAAASPVLKGLLSNDMEEGRQGFANIDEDEAPLRTLLQFMYIGSLPICADHNLLLSAMRLSDIYHVPSLAAACASRLLPQVNEENVLQVLCDLKQLQDVNRVCKDLFKAVQHMVKYDERLLDLVCSNVAPRTLHEGTNVESNPQISLAPARLDEDTEKTLDDHPAADIADSSRSKSQAGSDYSNAGPSHVPSGSSEKNALGGHESSPDDRKMCPDQQTELEGARLKHHREEPEY
jgi:hypothetical protein